MRGRCPVCKKYNKNSDYLGIVVMYDNNYKIFQCKHGEVLDCEKTYFKESKQDKSISIILENEIKEILQSRIQCPLCKTDKGNLPLKNRRGRNYKYKFVVSKGNSNRFYCSNHLDKKYNRYEFRIVAKKISMTLKMLLTKISSKLFSRIDDIYRAKEVYDFRKDQDHLLEFFFSINLSHDLLAVIFHTSQPTIFRLSKKEDVPPITKVNTIKRDKSRLFYSRVNISTIDLEDIEEDIIYEDGTICLGAIYEKKFDMIFY